MAKRGRIAMRPAYASLIVCAVMGAMDFEVPGPAERSRAIGPTEGLEEPLRRALDPEGFEPIPEPAESDWLAVREEAGQTFKDFLVSKKKRPEKERKTVYLLPLGEFPEERSPPLESLRAHAAAYFSLEVKVLPSRSIEGLELTTRRNPYTGNVQVLTGDVLAHLEKALPPDAFCLLAITMEDLYPQSSWNYVFGQALLGGRVGVFSFARYDPAFNGEKRGADYRTVLLRRSARVLVHETAHMFGLAHCIHFTCVMNGSNHLEESDSRPLHLCPVCLRKLHSSVRFDVVERYRELLGFYRSSGLEEETRWVEGRLKAVSGEGG